MNRPTKNHRPRHQKRRTHKNNHSHVITQRLLQDAENEKKIRALMETGEAIFCPLGGSGEIGQNLNLYIYKQKILIVDCGIMFNRTLGTEIVMPSLEGLKPFLDNIVGVVITHGHEDHIGALPYLMPFLACPVYATPFTYDMIAAKINEEDLHSLHVMPSKEPLHLDPFTVTPYPITHSIVEAHSLLIDMGEKRIFHTGDWKLDPQPMAGEATDIALYEALKSKPVTAMMCDSTNVFEEGSSGSEESVFQALDRLLESHKNNTVVVSCFASNVARMVIVSKLAEKYNRQVAIVGRSLLRIENFARKHGYLSGNAFITEGDLHQVQGKNLIILCTGSQGEQNAALWRMAHKRHPSYSLFGVPYGEKSEHAPDVVILSSRVIPGNEEAINQILNRLALLGVPAITCHDDDGIHVSGHPNRLELLTMYRHASPFMAIPVHGTHSHLIEHAHFAKDHAHVPHTLPPKNGEMIVLDEKGPYVGAIMKSGRWVLDGRCVVSSDARMLKLRKAMGENGVILATLGKRSVKVSSWGVFDDEGDQESDRVVYEQQLRDMLEKLPPHESPRFYVDKIRNWVQQEREKNPLIQVHTTRERVEVADIEDISDEDLPSTEDFNV